jgi:hypothetical protein
MKQLKPITDPLVLRDRTIHDYRNNVLRQGGEPDMDVIEELAVKDLQLVDAYYRVDQPHKKPKKKTAPRGRSNELAQHLQEHDIELEQKPIPEPEKERPPFGLLDVPAHLVSPRWSAALARIVRIMEPRGNVQEAMVKGGIFAVIKELAYPKLAKLVIENYLAFVLHNMPLYNNKPNPYWGRTQPEAVRIYMRAIEDICDKSTAEPGLRHWWVK